MLFLSSETVGIVMHFKNISIPVLWIDDGNVKDTRQFFDRTGDKKQVGGGGSWKYIFFFGDLFRQFYAIIERKFPNWGIG